MRKLTKRTAVAGVGAAALVTAGIAYAYWTTTGFGSGTGATTAGVINTLSFTQTPLVSAMYPGDSSQSLSVTVANTHLAQKVYVTGVSAYITTGNAGCTGADFNLNGSTTSIDAGSAVPLTWTPQELDAGGLDTDDATGTVQFNNTGDNQDACKGAVVTIHYLAS